MGAYVTLCAKRSIRGEQQALSEIRRTYGVTLQGVRLFSYFSSTDVGNNARIALNSLRSALSAPADVIVSRNLYAAYVLAVLWRRKIVFETHQLEYGIRKSLQRAVMVTPHVRTVVISERLRELLVEHHGKAPSHCLVLPDAAPEGITPLPVEQKRSVLRELLPDVALERWRAVCAYFGHLYSGRGIEIIEQMAHRCRDLLFLVYGGNEIDIRARRAANTAANLLYAGFIPHSHTQEAMSAVDVLLMPYQEQVSIGVRGHDTAKWMSPMKMFEYLASGTPIVSSDIPVLREVLLHDINALLVPPSNVDSWIGAVHRVLTEPGLADRIGHTAHETYRGSYTWSQRACRMLEAF